ncbi:hypothetical protein ACFFVB_16905 [Formosa undariae]|uniref:Uncharacterized protein n=1 Tax=Formosa undariae TaxID=1325436 RepID=A0ABV5F5Q4_9FLAO
MRDSNPQHSDTLSSSSLKSSLKSTFKDGTKVNRIYENLKKGKLDLLIPEHLGEPMNSTHMKYLLPAQKHITLSLKHCRPIIEQQKNDLSHRVDSDSRPDILTMHKIKIPTGYTPKKVFLSYQIYTDAEESVQINFKVGKLCKHIKPSVDAKKTKLEETHITDKNQTLFEGSLEFNLDDDTQDAKLSSTFLNEDNEIPFSLFVHESTHHLFHISIACDLEKTTFKNWPINTYRKLKDDYKIQRDEYEKKFREQQQQDEHSLLDWL